MYVDYPLFGALAAGILAGRLIAYRTPWVTRGALACIVALVGLWGTRIGASETGNLTGIVVESVALAGLLLVVTGGFAFLLGGFGRSTTPSPGAAPSMLARLGGLALLGVFVTGFLIGRSGSSAPDLSVSIALDLLVLLVVFDLPLDPATLRRLGVPLVAALAGALVAGLAFALTGAVTPTQGVAIAMGFGWYTLEGPVLAAAAGASIGLVAFLTNFFRENLTMVSAPLIGSRVGGEGLTSLAGASSMDTNLLFITRFGDPKAGGLALSSGVILTVVAAIADPLLAGTALP